MPGSAFLYIGADGVNFPLRIPYPTRGNANFDTTVNLTTQENANGALVGQVRGNTRIAQQVGWVDIEAKTWWEINRWFEQNGPFCYLRYFSHNVGEWRTGRFLCTQFTCDPLLVGEDGAATLYENAHFTLTSTGAT